MDIENEENCMETEEQFLLQPAETNTKYVYVNTRVDYQYRSASLDNMWLHDYICLYHKKPINARGRKQLEAQSEMRSIQTKRPQRSRPFSEREMFQVEHPQVASCINIKRKNRSFPSCSVHQYLEGTGMIQENAIVDPFLLSFILGDQFKMYVMQIKHGKKRLRFVNQEFYLRHGKSLATSNYYNNVRMIVTNIYSR